MTELEAGRQAGSSTTIMVIPATLNPQQRTLQRFWSSKTTSPPHRHPHN